jgi:hydrogenase maturation factor
MCLGSIGRLDRVWDEGGLTMGIVDYGDRQEAACLMYVPDVEVGSDVLVHMGFVLEVLDPARAADARALRSGEMPDFSFPGAADRG